MTGMEWRFEALDGEVRHEEGGFVRVHVAQPARMDEEAVVYEEAIEAQRRGMAIGEIATLLRLRGATERAIAAALARLPERADAGTEAPPPRPSHAELSRARWGRPFRADAEQEVKPAPRTKRPDHVALSRARWGGR